MKQYYTVTKDADTLAPKWLTTRINYYSIKFVYRIEDGISKLKGVMYLIVVKIRENGLTIDGHAGYAEKGKDIVCAAVSALAQGLIRSLCAFTEDETSVEVEDGHIKLEYENLSERGQLLMDSFFIAVSDIQDAYGEEYVQIQ